MLTFLRWLYGYVVFVAKGSFPERFMNLTARSGISLWNIKKEDDTFSASSIAREYKSLRHLARKSNIKLKIKEKHGAPFFINRYKKRLGIPIGIIGFILTIYFLSLYIWSIDVSGNINITEEEVKSIVLELGLHSGSLKGELNIPMIEQNAMMRLKDISWLSVNIQGSCAHISLRERIIEPKMLPKDKPCNIKASCDGQIDRIDVYEGLAMVQNGDAVVKGQLLVSGVVEDTFGGNTIRHAAAKVNAHTKREIHEQIKLNQTFYENTGKSIVKRRINILGIELPLSFFKAKDKVYYKEIKDNNLQIGKASIPISIYKEIWHEQYATNVTLTAKEAATQAEAKVKERESNEMKDIKILQKSKTDWVNDNTYHLDINYDCIENIANEEPIIILK